MNNLMQKKERKVVPRFRRRNAAKNQVDADDEEAQALVEKDLRSEFVWKSDANVNSQHQFDVCENKENSAPMSFVDDETSNLIYDIEHQEEQLWKNNVGTDESQSVQWIDGQPAEAISFSLKSTSNKKQNWTLSGGNQPVFKLNLSNQHFQQHKVDLEGFLGCAAQLFVQGEEFRNQIRYDAERSHGEENSFITGEEDFSMIPIDPDVPSINFSISLPQAPMLRRWLKGTSQLNLSPSSEKLSRNYSPLDEFKSHIDSNHLKALRWSLDVLKENLIYSYLVALSESESQVYSFDSPDCDPKISIDDNHHQQLLSLSDFSFQQIFSLTSSDFKQQLLSAFDALEIRRDFGRDDRNESYSLSLESFESIFTTYSPEEILELIYSPHDAKQIELKDLLVASDEVSARAFRRYRCKHMSIQIDEDNRLDAPAGFQLEFRGNETNAVDERTMHDDFSEPQIYRDVTNNAILLEKSLSQSYDLSLSDHLHNRTGPCLYRSDYECQPPKTWTRLRREIGWISFDASLSQPHYVLNKSYKRFVHIPTKRDNCSYNVYRGYKEFLDTARSNPENYFRSFDSTDLRPLLNWYSQKQYLFSSTDQRMLKPPTFICRRLVLMTILANLYCDSEPWKLLVVRVKGQFYLALANKKTKSIEEMTEDEYSGFKFEDLFTTDQPNSTRLAEKISPEHPQRQFHTVQYWRFGDFNLLYSNEIDGEIKVNEPENPPSSDDTATQEEQSSSKETPTENSENSNNKDWCTEEIQMQLEQLPNELQKEIQINENLQITASDETEVVCKKKRDELKSGYIELKCTNKKIFYRDENKLKTLNWWAQMWLANVNTLMIGYKSGEDGLVNQIDLLSIDKLIWRFLSKYDLHLKYCISYLHSFLKLIQKTVLIDDPNTIHAFAYIPQPLEIDPSTGKPVEYDLPKYVPFRYTQIKRSSQRHENFMPQWYIEFLQRTTPLGGVLQDDQLKTVEQETKQRIGHRGRASCILKREQQQNRRKSRRK